MFRSMLEMNLANEDNISFDMEVMMDSLVPLFTSETRPSDLDFAENRDDEAWILGYHMGKSPRDTFFSTASREGRPRAFSLL